MLCIGVTVFAKSSLLWFEKIPKILYLSMRVFSCTNLHALTLLPGILDNNTIVTALKNEMSSCLSIYLLYLLTRHKLIDEFLLNAAQSYSLCVCGLGAL